MSVLKPRNRLVNFRLSEEEFDGMKTACESSGARSLSDFARGAVLNAIEAAKAGQSQETGGGAHTLARLDGAVASLESRIGQLMKLMEVIQSHAQAPVYPGEHIHG